MKVNKDKKEEVRKLKKQSKRDFLSEVKNESNQSTVYCDKCSEKISDMTNLKAHVRFYHMISNSTQTDEKPFENKQNQTTCSEAEVIKVEESFQSYPCYYCSNLIVSEECLQNHREKCHVKQPTFKAVDQFKSRFHFSPFQLPKSIVQPIPSILPSTPPFIPTLHPSFIPTTSLYQPLPYQLPPTATLFRSTVSPKEASTFKFSSHPKLS